MTYKIEFDGGCVRTWDTTATGAVSHRDDDYTASFFVGADASTLDALALRLEADPKVTDTTRESRYRTLHADSRTPVLRIDVERIDELRAVATEIRHRHEPAIGAFGTLRLFDLDFAQGFRYCLDRGIDPTPGRALRTLTIDIPRAPLQNGELSALELDGESVTGTESQILRAVSGRIRARDPDVLICSSTTVVPTLYERAAELGVRAFDLGRAPGWTQLAGRTTYESYGQTRHSPPRYDVPGRVLIDRSNSFLWGKAGLSGLLELVSRSHKPLQEIGWASIGTAFTAIQIREARERDVCVPANAWEPETFKSVSELHTADRGGHIFEPAVGVHQNVVEVDFASLYPNIICEHNISAETVRCDCHSSTVPAVGYSICEQPGFLPDVLQPLVDARAAYKQQVRDASDPERQNALEARVDALKWVLVCCFGYQGYRHSKFGRIECHEAINAYARETMLTAAALAESAGWDVVHGIVDSLWLTPHAPGPTPIQELCEQVTDAVGIALEVEHRFDWLAFPPRRHDSGGALMRYFGPIGDPSEFKTRGIECRQRGTPRYIGESQRAMLEALGDHCAPDAVTSVLDDQISALHDGAVEASDLLVRRRASSSLEAYNRETHTVAALQRAKTRDFSVHPGEDLRYVVVNDEAARNRQRVRLDFEEPDTYDPAYYENALIRAATSLVSPFGWSQADVRATLETGATQSLANFR